MNDAIHESLAVSDALALEIRRQVEEGVEKLDWRRLQLVAHRSRRQIDRVFRARFESSPAQYMRALRTASAEQLLASGHDVLNAAVKAGFSGPGRLHDALVARRGLSPGEIRRAGAGLRVAFGVFATPIGAVLLAATQRGICCLRICTLKSPAEHLEELRETLPQAEFVEDSEATRGYAEQLVAFLERRAQDFRPELDVTGTPFQEAVWRELRKLKPGERISYGGLARRLGREGAARAVAGACARNPVAIAIPCHRVVEQGGGLGGYAWGVAQKRRLLELERPWGGGDVARKGAKLGK